MSRVQNAGRSHNINCDNISCATGVEEFKYFGATSTNRFRKKLIADWS